MKAVVMAGGSGTRFWPLSRTSRPKQFLTLSGDRSLIQLTVERLMPLIGPGDLFVVCGPAHELEVRRQLPDLTDEQVLVEPVPRNTAACAGLAAQYLATRFGPGTMALLPSDHMIRENREFLDLLQAADELAKQGWLVTFAIRPSFPATGYGYIERGETLGCFQGNVAFRARRFIEKPDEQAARGMLEAGGHFWNSGMFVWHTDVFLEEVRTWMPQLHKVLVQAEATGFRGPGLMDSFSSLKSIPVDVGILERSSKVATLPCEPGWSDVGSWQALDEIFGSDDQGNVAGQLCLALDSQRCIVHTSDGEKIVALLGVQDLVVVDTADALLICSRERTEEIRRVVEKLKESQLDRFA